ncbi:MAG: alpha/beta hydrolase [Chloroflexaceae bacterium]|jgi:valacyclovir hydrolase|nr:alpha/beta hydrolase [Chloroflexaceae bacterium]
MPYVNLPDARLAYLDEGNGPPLLLIHGFTGTGHNHFAPLFAQLKAEYRLLAPDLRGYGASQPPQRSFPPDFYGRDAADMAALLDALAPGPVTVLGFSDGAESALLLAAMRPDLVRGVVAWGVSGIIAPAMVESVQAWLPVSAWGPDRDEWRNEIIELHGEHQLVPMIEGWVAAAEAIAASGGNICLAEAAHIRCPVLLINGEGEVGNPLDDVQRLATRIPNARLEIVPGAGHGIQWEQPERLAALVRAFLAEMSEER